MSVDARRNAVVTSGEDQDEAKNETNPQDLSRDEVATSADDQRLLLTMVGLLCRRPPTGTTFLPRGESIPAGMPSAYSA